MSTFGGASVTMGYPSADAAWSSIKSTLSNQGVSIFFVCIMDDGRERANRRTEDKKRKKSK